MKKVILNTIVMITMLFTMAACDKEKSIQPNDLPTQATAFLTTYFPTLDIAHAKKEKEGLFGREYTVYLNEGTEISFDKNGDWIEVDGVGNSPIPTGFILEPIVTYVTEKYPNAAISSIEKNRNGFEVELTNEIDLEFDSKGTFRRID